MIGTIIVAILCLGLCSLLFNLKNPIEGIIDVLCGIVDAVLRPISKPVRKLWQWLKEHLLDWLSWGDKLPIARFADRYPVFGRPSGIRLFLICLIYLIVSFCTMSLEGLAEFVISLFYSMPMGFLIQMLSENVPFDPVNLLSAGFTGFMILMLFRTCLKENYYFGSKWKRLPVKILYYIVLCLTACTLSTQLGFVWDSLASFGLNSFSHLQQILGNTQWTFMGVLEMLYFAFMFLLLLYVGIMLLLVSIREFIDIIGYSVIGLLITIVVVLLMQTFLPDSIFGGDLKGNLTGLAAVAVMFYADYTRVDKDLEAYED